MTDNLQRHYSYLIHCDIREQICFWKCMQIAVCGIVSYLAGCKEKICWLVGLQRVMNIFWWRITVKVWNDKELGDVPVELLHCISFMTIHYTNSKRQHVYTQPVLYDKDCVRMCVYSYKWSVWFCTCLCLGVCLHDVTEFVLWVWSWSCLVI